MTVKVYMALRKMVFSKCSGTMHLVTLKVFSRALASHMYRGWTWWRHAGAEVKSGLGGGSLKVSSTWMEPKASTEGSLRLAKLQLLPPEISTNLEAKEVALQPEGNDFQDDAQKNRNYVEDGVDGSLQDLLLVNVLTGCIQVKHGSRNQHCH